MVGMGIDVNWAIITYFLQWVSTVLVEDANKQNICNLDGFAFLTLIDFIKDVFWRQILLTVPAPSDNDIYTLIKGTPRYIF